MQIHCNILPTWLTLPAGGVNAFRRGLGHFAGKADGDEPLAGATVNDFTEGRFVRVRRSSRSGQVPLAHALTLGYPLFRLFVLLTLFGCSLASTQPLYAVSTNLFLAPFFVPTGGNSYSVAGADFNGDGWVDLASANYPPTTLSVMLNDGTGHYPTTNMLTGVGYYYVTVADVNNDLKPDLISIDYGSGLSVCTNTGTGGFVIASTKTLSTFGNGNPTTSIATGDFNGDGWVDVVVGYQSGTQILVLTNNGKASFAQSAALTVGSGPLSVVVMDINHDGKPDIVSANSSSGTLSILTNNGSGGFSLAGSPAIGTSPGYITTGDMNFDGWPDLACFGGNLSVLTNNHVGGFNTYYSTNNESFSFGGDVKIADFNGDGRPDLVVGNNGGSGGGYTHVLTNNGVGGFVRVTNTAFGSTLSPWGLFCADLNGDGLIDLVAADTHNKLSVVFGNPDFPRQAPLSVDWAAPAGGAFSNSVAPGGTTSFSVAVSGGAAPFSYQWLRNRAVVVGATNSTLTIANASVEDSGLYSVVVGDAVGRIKISLPVSLAVGTPYLLGWGDNQYGQYGDGTTNALFSPKLLNTNVLVVDSGRGHTLMLAKNGSLYAAGLNQNGQLGIGNTNDSPIPILVSTNVISVAAGYTHSIFLKADGTAWGMGANAGYYLGDGTTADRWSPVLIGSNVVSVAAGGFFTLLLKNDGGLYVSGLNNFGQLGFPRTINNVTTPTLIDSNVISINPGQYESFYLKSDLTLWGMGWNSFNPISPSASTFIITPTQMATNVIQFCGGDRFVMYETSDRVLWGTGKNLAGNLGDGTTNTASIPQIMATNVFTFTCGQDAVLFTPHSHVVLADGTFISAGANSRGELGDGTTNNQLSWVQIPLKTLSSASAHYGSTTFGIGSPSSPYFSAPIANKTVNEMTNLSFYANASVDFPGVPVSYLLANAPAGAAIDTNTGLFSWTPAEDQGPMTVTMSITATVLGDPNLSASQSFTVTVDEVNRAPVLSVQTNVTINGGSWFTRVNTASDPDLPLNQITYALSSARAGMTVDGSGLISWHSPHVVSNTTYTVTTIATDNGIPPLSATNSFAITAVPHDDPPVLGSVSNHYVNVGSNVSFTLSATDPDDSVFTFKANGLPMGALFNTNSGAFFWTPNTNQAGTYRILFAVFDPSRLSSTITNYIVVIDNRLPWFTNVPSDRALLAGDILTLTSAAENASSLQWYFKSAPIAGATNASLAISNFTVSQAGIYYVVAANQYGTTKSPNANVTVLTPAAATTGAGIEGGSLAFRPDGALRLRAWTVPGKSYSVRRTFELGSGQWQTIGNFVATGENYLLDDPDAPQHPKAFYQLVEQPATPPQVFSLQDTTRFIAIGADGATHSGLLPAFNATNGQMGALDYTPDGKSSPADRRLVIHLPTGGTVVSNGNSLCLQVSSAQIFFPYGCPIQLDPPIVISNRNVCIPLGPLGVSTLEQLAGLPPGSGIGLKIFDKFELKWTKGELENGQLRNAEFSALAKGGVALPLPGGHSASFSDFHVSLELRDGELKIPFSGEFDLKDGSDTPLKVTVSDDSPVTLTLSQDGRASLSGKAEAEFDDGPSFSIDINLEDPVYHLALSAKNLSVPALMDVSGLLPVPTVPGTSAPEDAATLDAALEALRLSYETHSGFIGLLAGDKVLQQTNKPAFLPTAGIPPHHVAAIQFWRGLVKANAINTFPDELLSAASRSAHSAAASGSALEAMRILSEMKKLNDAAGNSVANHPHVELQADFDEAIAAAQRLVQDTPATIPLSDMQDINREALKLESTIQLAGGSGTGVLLQGVVDLTERVARDYVANRVGLLDNGELSSDSTIPKMAHLEAIYMMQILLNLNCQLQQIASTDTALADLINQAVGKLGEQAAQLLRTEMLDAFNRRERSRYLSLLDEFSVLARAQQSLGDYGSALPESTEFQSAIDLLRNPEMTSSDYSNELANRTPAQLRDLSRQMASALRHVPFGVNVPVDSMKQIWTQFGAVVKTSTELMKSSAAAFPPQEFVDRIEAILAHEELRQRYALAPDSDSLLPQLETTVNILVREAVPKKGWGEILVSENLLLNECDRLKGLGPVESSCGVSDTFLADSASVRHTRAVIQRLAATLLVSSKQVGGALWQDSATRRNADPSLAFADMLLPGGFSIEEASGEVTYHRDSGQVAGAFSGKLKVPQFDASLNVISATLDTGGAISFSVAGSAAVPRDGQLAKFEVPERRPLKFSLDKDRHVSLEGSAKLTLRNGASFEGWMTMNDPMYQFGARAGNLRLSIATNFIGRIQVPNTSQIAQIPGVTQPILSDYFSSLGRSLDPLTDLTDAPKFNAVGEPPAFSESIATLDTDPLVLSSSFISVLVSNASAFGFTSLTDAHETVSNLMAGLNKSIQREIKSMQHAAADAAAPRTPAERSAESLNRIKKLQEQGSSLSRLLDLAGGTAGATASGEGFQASGVNDLVGAVNSDFMGAMGFEQSGGNWVNTHPEILANTNVLKACIGFVGNLYAARAKADAMNLNSSTVDFTINNSVAQTLVNALAQNSQTRVEAMLQNISTNGPGAADITYDQARDASAMSVAAFQLAQLYGVDDGPFDASVRAIASDAVDLQASVISRDISTTLPTLSPNKTAAALKMQPILRGAMVELDTTRQFFDLTGNVTVHSGNGQQHSFGSAMEFADSEEGNCGSGGNPDPATPGCRLQAASEFWEAAQNGGMTVEQRLGFVEYKKAISDPFFNHSYYQATHGESPHVALQKMVTKLNETKRLQVAQKLSKQAKGQYSFLKTRVTAPDFDVRGMEALTLLRQALQIGAMLEAAGYQGAGQANANATQLDEFHATVLPAINQKITALATTRQAWWIATQAAQVLHEGLSGKAEADMTVLDLACRDAAKTTLATAAQLIGVIKNHLSTDYARFDFKLPGDIVVNNVWGQLTVNTRSNYVQGCFGGDLAFPNLNNLEFNLPEICFATDGSFSFEGSVTNLKAGTVGSTPVFFSGGLKASGKADLSIPTSASGLLANWKGTAFSLEGTGSLKLGINTADGTLTYKQDGNGAWSFSASPSWTGVQRFGDDVVLFAANGNFTAGYEGQTVSSGLSLGGKMGIWRKDRSHPLPADDGLVSVTNFQLVVDNVQISESNSITVLNSQTNGTLTLSVNSGTLQLPKFFYPAQDLPPDLQCSTNASTTGASITVHSNSPVVLQLAINNNVVAAPQLTGTIEFSQFGFSLPALTNLAAVICKASLAFEPNGPVLRIDDGRLSIPLPGQTLALGLRNAKFDLYGLPVGEVDLLDKFKIFDLGGVQASLLPVGNNGGAPVSNFSVPQGSNAPVKGTSFIVTNDSSNNKYLVFNGALEFTIPASLLKADAANSGSGGRTTPTTGTDTATVGALLTGSLEIHPRSDRLPDVSFQLGDFGIHAQNAVWHLAGGGIGIKDPGVDFINLTGILNPTTNTPTIIRLTGTLIVAEQFSLGLNNARFIFESPGKPPRFQIDGASFATGTNSVIGYLPFQLNSASIGFIDSGKSLPDLLRPDNVKVKFTATVALPAGNNPILSGQLSDVTIGFNADGTPAIPALDGLELGLNTDKFPPFNQVSGKVRMGGFQGAGPDDLYMIGVVQGQYSTTKLKVLVAFTMKGVLGYCLDVSGGSAGVPLGPTGFLYLGSQAGVSFLEGGGNPCDFATYFHQDSTGRFVVNNSLPPTGITWEQFRDIANRMFDLAHSGLPQVSYGGSSSGHSAPAASGLTQSFPSPLPADSSPALSTDCPTNIPPRTINLLYQLHPDTVRFPGRVILKFSSISGSTLTNLGITRANFANASAAQSAGNIAQNVVGEVRRITPLPNASGFAPLASFISNALATAELVVSNRVYDTFTNSQNTVYDKIVDLMYQGIPGQDITMLLSGRFSYAGLSTFAYVEGAGVISSAGTAGVIGTVNLIGIPVGQGAVYVSGTDDQGAPNPSMSGKINVSFGPLQLGELTAVDKCDGCVTAFASAFPQMINALGEPLARYLLAQAAPDIDWSQMSGAQMITKLASLPPQTAIEIQSRAIGAITSFDPSKVPPGLPIAIPKDLPKTMIQILGNTWDSIQPQMNLCGDVTPKLFGLSMGGHALFAQVVEDKTGYMGQFTYPMSYLNFIFPGSDEADFSFRLKLKDPIAVLLAAMNGDLSNPQKAADFAGQQVDYMLNNMSMGIAYKMHPFGLELGDAAMRAIMPDFVNHPEISGWKKPEDLNIGLPSRDSLLVTATVGGNLGDVFNWEGSTNDLQTLYQGDAASHDALVAHPLDLRHGYFPHGGIVGGARMALPKILMKSPSEWLPLYATIIDGSGGVAGIPARIDAATQLIQGYVLATETNGTLAFYLAAPTPPILKTGVNATAAQLAADLGSLNLSGPQLAAIYPSGVSFLRGDMTNLNILGIPVAGTATLRGNPQPSAINDPSPLATLTFTNSANSWLGKLTGKNLSFTASLYAVPPKSIQDRFGALLVSLTNSTPPSPEALVNDVVSALKDNLPRFGVTNDLGKLDMGIGMVGAPVPLPVPTFNPKTLPNPILRFNTCTLYAFSPFYQPTNTGSDPVSLAAKQGGLAISSSFTFLPNISGFSASSSGKFALVQDNGLPRLVGLIQGLPLLFLPGLDFSGATAAFDTGAADFLIVSNSFPPLTTFGNIFAVNPAGGGNALAVNLILSGISGKSIPFRKGVDLPFSPRFEITPARISSSLLPGLDFSIHGSASSTAKFTLGLTEIDAKATLGANGGLNVYLPGASGLGPVAEILGLQGQFDVTGGMDNPGLSLDFPGSSGGLTVNFFPSVTSRLGLPSSFTIAAGGLKDMSLSSDGSFSLHATIGSFSLNGTAFDTGATLAIENGRLTIHGSAGSISAYFDAGVFRVDTDVEITLPAICIPVAQGSICISGPNGGDIHASAGNNGFTVTTVYLTFSNLAPNGAAISIPIAPLNLDQDLKFTSLGAAAKSAVRSAVSSANGLSLRGFQLPSFSDFDLSGELDESSVTALISSHLQLGSILDIPVKVSLGNKGLQAWLDDASGTMNILGFAFHNVACGLTNKPPQPGSRSSPVSSAWKLQFEGDLAIPGLDWITTPHFKGSIPSSGGFSLNTINSCLPNFPMLNSGLAVPSLIYNPLSAPDYADEIRSDSPSGYWRMEKLNFTTNINGTVQSWVEDSSNDQKLRGTPHGSLTGYWGALEDTNDWALVFPGVFSSIDIPVPSDAQDRLNPDAGSGALTVEAWFSSTGAPYVDGLSGPQYLASREHQWDLSLAPSGNGHPNIRFNVSGLKNLDGTDASALTSSTVISDWDWHHVVAVYDGFRIALYIDGKLDTWRLTQGNKPNTSSADLILGARVINGGEQGWFNGIMDEVVFYRRALDPAAVLSHYTAASKGGIAFSPKLNSFAGMNTDLAGFIGKDGSMAFATTATASPTLGGIELPSFSGMVFKNAAGMAMAFDAQLSPPPLLSGSPLRVAGQLNSDGTTFNLAAHGDYLGFRNDEFALSNLVVTANNSGNNFSGTFYFPRFLGNGQVKHLNFSGNLAPLNINLVGPAFDLPLGPGTLSIDTFNFQSPAGLTMAGDYKVNGNTVSRGSFQAAPNLGTVSLNVSGDTCWQSASGYGWKIPLVCPDCYTVCPPLLACYTYCPPCVPDADMKNWTKDDISFAHPYMRLAWNLGITASTSLSRLRVASSVSGIFRISSALNQPDCSSVGDVSFGVSGLSLDSGKVTIEKPYGPFDKFYLQLW